MSLPGSPPEPGPLRRVLDQVAQVVVGHHEAVVLALVALVAGGHVLLEDLPGVGKTTLATALARSLGLSVRRVQGTADLLPADLTGALVPDGSGELRFRPGPLFANIVLADELEAMEEAAVTVDGTTHRLPQPFLVLATQNPADSEGVFPLPQSQRDRFLLSLALGYPEPADELELLTRGELLGRADQLPAALGPDELLGLRAAVDQVHVAPAVRQYLLEVLLETRRHPAVLVGPSPRAGLGLQRAARALALVEGREFVVPRDLQQLAGPVLAHRVQLAPAAVLAGRRPAEVLAEVLARLPAPGPGPLPGVDQPVAPARAGPRPRRAAP
ncbi:AAA family ATPase [Aciditerrimonas ferrireducens]|uniref:AAA family ATPase n=1 Tax=Aciditerrimonas ferrireducens TaxID=667306 RepID=UPI00289A4EC8|nr:MoxR family ATPase [Aciditerrimonas ferrireducens]